MEAVAWSVAGVAAVVQPGVAAVVQAAVVQPVVVQPVVAAVKRVAEVGAAW